MPERSAPDAEHQGVDVVVNPWTGETVSRRPHATDEQVDAAVAAAAAAFQAGADEPAWKRAERLKAAADAVVGASDELVEMLIESIGKPRRAAAVEVRRAAAVFRLCAEILPSFGGDSLPADAVPGGEGRWSLTFHHPYGVAALVTPFNAPLNLLVQKLAPALATGNTAVVKPSPEGAAVTERLVELVAPHFRDDAVHVVHGGPAQVRRLVASPLVRVVSLTGGNVAGRAVLEAAGLKPVHLELGSNSPNIVLGDANIQKAAEQIARAGFEASGQQCVSAQRVLVESSAVADFTAAFVAAADALVVGDPADPATEVGPMIHSASARRVAEMIRAAEEDEGAKVLLDGRKHAVDNERLVGPTVLAGVSSRARVMCEEVFGPVVVVNEVEDLEEAIAVANDVPGMLQASCFTSNVTAAMRASRELWAGSVWINEATRFRLDTYPFGGTGTSGLGREGIRYAMEAFSQLKHVGMSAS